MTTGTEVDTKALELVAAPGPVPSATATTAATASSTRRASPPTQPPPQEQPMTTHPTTDPTTSDSPGDGLHPPGRDLESAIERVEMLESQVQALGQAIRTLVQGMEEIPDQEPDPEQAARSARLAHELLLAQGL
ncbi:hypothetical protein [Kitasatospora sp. NPDC088548]|uniref:hypothetical protein n=1 Tax=Kitasatospora sp. NPDC088548 TaxID=3364075 RepID=UPI0037F3B0C5